MPLSALLLSLFAAWCHATWNLYLKKSEGGSIAFFWLLAWFESLIYAPLTLSQLRQSAWLPDARAHAMLLGSALIHVAYFVFLLIGCGAVLPSGSPLAKFRRGGHGIGFALASGAVIALYTVWDRQAVAPFLIQPIVF